MRQYWVLDNNDCEDEIVKNILNDMQQSWGWNNDSAHFYQIGDWVGGDKDFIALDNYIQKFTQDKEIIIYYSW